MHNETFEETAGSRERSVDRESLTRVSHLREQNWEINLCAAQFGPIRGMSTVFSRCGRDSLDISGRADVQKMPRVLLSRHSPGLLLRVRRMSMRVYRADDEQVRAVSSPNSFPLFSSSLIG